MIGHISSFTDEYLIGGYDSCQGFYGGLLVKGQKHNTVLLDAALTRVLDAPSNEYTNSVRYTAYIVYPVPANKIGQKILQKNKKSMQIY